MIAVDRAPHVLLIPETLQPHGGDSEGELAMILSSAWLCQNPSYAGCSSTLPEWKLIGRRLACEITGRTRLQKARRIRRIFGCGIFEPCLVQRFGRQVVDIRLPKGAVVEPVVSHPPIDHGALGRRNFERGMRMDEGHDDSEALIARTDHADSAVRLVNILHQPVDGVIGVGRIVDFTMVEGTTGGGVIR